MKFFIDDLPVLFPYPRIYPGNTYKQYDMSFMNNIEQYSYMCHLKKTLDVGGHCVLEVNLYIYWYFIGIILDAFWNRENYISFITHNLLSEVLSRA